MELSVDITERGVDAALARGASRIALQRRAGTPDLTRVDLTAIPLAWTRALLAQAWPEATLTGGSGDARLRITPAGDALRIAGPLALRGASLDTPDGRIAAEGVAARFDLDMQLGDTDRVRLKGELAGGELLFGTTYLALAGRRIGIELDAMQAGACCWRIPNFEWRDPGALHARGAMAFGTGLTIEGLDVDVRSDDLALARDAYLSGWLGAAGLASLELRGGAAVRVSLGGGGLRSADLRLSMVHARDPSGRFAFEALDGDVRFSADAPIDSELRVAGGSVYGLAFGASRIPLRSTGGELQTTAPVPIPMLGGALRLDALSVRPPAPGSSARAAFGLEVDGLDVAQLAQAFGWPAFPGRLSGRIPQARYEAGRLVFDGGLAMRIFGGKVDISELSMERPFGVAPTLAADVRFDDLDLEALTGVLGFGSITGLLDGRIAGLRLVDWQPVAFDASLRTDRRRGVRQRISQRAVQDLSSVGDASFVTSLQSQLIGFFDDFAYSRLGIDCRLADQVCDMGGLAPRGDNAFLIVQGRGIPRLTVVGINRRVDWPMLVERLMAVGSGESKPVVD
jgi:hypothetical protein